MRNADTHDWFALNMLHSGPTMTRSTTRLAKGLMAIAAIACLVMGPIGKARAQETNPGAVVPIPEPFQIDPPETGPDPDNPLQLDPPTQNGGQTDPARSQTGVEDGEVKILYDLEALPQPVKRMRELIIEAATTGDLEALRPLLGTGPDITQLSFGGIDGDPIDYIRSISGDSEGQEMLAILIEVFEAGYVHLDEGKDTELFVWPYFFAMNLESLTAPQKVELFKLVTAGDYDDMLSFGAYIFFRAGITPEGRWLFFVAGD